MIIHEFKNVSVSRSIGGDYYVDSSEGSFLHLSPNGSEEHDRIEKWIADPDRKEEDFFDNEFMMGIFTEAMADKDIDHEFWNCPDCGDWMRAIEFADSWWCQDDDQGPEWFEIYIRPDWETDTCPNCD